MEKNSKIRQLSKEIKPGESFNPRSEHVWLDGYDLLRRESNLTHLECNHWLDIARACQYSDAPRIKIQTFAEKNKCSKRTSIRCIDELINQGFVKKGGSGHGGEVNSYRLLFHPLFAGFPPYKPNPRLRSKKKNLDDTEVNQICPRGQPEYDPEVNQTEDKKDVQAVENIHEFSPEKKTDKVFKKVEKRRSLKKAEVPPSPKGVRETFSSSELNPSVPSSPKKKETTFHQRVYDFLDMWKDITGFDIELTPALGNRIDQLILKSGETMDFWKEVFRQANNVDFSSGWKPTLDWLIRKQKKHDMKYGYRVMIENGWGKEKKQDRPGKSVGYRKDEYPDFQRQLEEAERKLA